MKYSYRPQGVCSRMIDFDVTDGKVSGVSFFGGCDGNLKAIGKLVEGKDAKTIAETLRGNTCGPRSTSCADQLANAIDQALGA